MRQLSYVPQESLRVKIAGAQRGLVEDASPGKQDPLAFLLRALGLSAPPPVCVRYQILHRAAFALVEAQRFHAVAAAMLGHSFSGRRAGHEDYEAFAGLCGVTAPLGRIVRLGEPNGFRPGFMASCGSQRLDPDCVRSIS